MEEIRQARQLILNAIPAQRRESINRDPATSWGLDNLLMALSLAARFSEDALQQPITERMEAKVLTLTCFRNSMLESVHAGEPALSLGDPDTPYRSGRQFGEHAPATFLLRPNEDTRHSAGPSSSLLLSWYVQEKCTIFSLILATLSLHG